MFVATLLLYGSPDIVMPIASALAAVVGILLMLWNRAASFVRRQAQSLRRRPEKLPAQRPSSANRSFTPRDRAR